MVKEYIFLASGCVVVGIVVAFAVITVSQRLGLDITGESLWVLAIPAVFTVILNIFVLELYRRFRKRK